MQTLQRFIADQYNLLEEFRKMLYPQINVDVMPAEIYKAIETCMEVVPEKPKHPILSTLLLRAKNGKITLTASNLETFIEVRINGHIIEEGAICIAATLFKNIVKAIKETDEKPLASIGIKQTSDRQILLTHKRYKATLKEAVVCEEYHFPVTPEVITTEKLYIPDLSSKFKRLQSFTKDDVLNPKFSGITLSKGSLIASNGCEVAAIANGYEADIEAVIPGSIPLDLLVNPSFYIDNGSVKFVDAEGTISVTTNLVKQPIDLEKITIPDSQICFFNKTEMLKQLPLFLGTNNKKTKQACPVWLELKNGKVTLRSIEFADTFYQLQTGVINPGVDISLYIDIKQFEKILKQSSSNCLGLYAGSETDLIAIKQDDFLIGFMPLPIIKNNVVVASGCGYSRPSDLPYSYNIESKCLTIDSNMIDCGYARAEYIGYEPTQRLAQMKKQAEEKAAWKECFDGEPQELLTAAINHQLTEKLLKDHYKSIKNFKSSRFGAKQKNWSEAVRSYIHDVNRWYEP